MRRLSSSCCLYAETRACWIASITISRGTPFSAASWVMAVTNSLFMLACPPLAYCKSARRMAPTTEEVGTTHFISVVSDDRTFWPCRPSVYHSHAGVLQGFTMRVRVGRPTCRGGGSARPGVRLRSLLELLFR